MIMWELWHKIFTLNKSQDWVGFRLNKSHGDAVIRLDFDQVPVV